MTHFEIRAKLAERLQALLEQAHNLPKTPYPYQRATLETVAQWLKNPQGTRRGYVEQATGLGKTYLFATLASFGHGLRTLIVVPTKVLVEQTSRMTAEFSGGIIGHLSSVRRITNERGKVVAAYGHEHSDIVVTTDEYFGQHSRRLALQFQPNLVIWDECHWGYSDLARRALAEVPEAVVIGFSATPDYLATVATPEFKPHQLPNGQELWANPRRCASAWFGMRLDRRDVHWGIGQGWLAPLAWTSIPLGLSLDAVPLFEGIGGLDYRPEALGRFLNDNWSATVAAVVRLYQSGAYALPQRQVFAVCPSVAMAEALAKTVSELGVPAACVSSQTTDKQRREILGGYKSGAIKLLTSVMVLREGWDAPDAEVCLMLRPTRSYVVYVQTMGRVLRYRPDKCALVLDAEFTDTHFPPLSAPALFGRLGQTVTEGDILLGPQSDSLGPAQAPASSPYRAFGNSTRTSTVAQISIEHVGVRQGKLVRETDQAPPASARPPTASPPPMARPPEAPSPPPGIAGTVSGPSSIRTSPATTIKRRKRVMGRGKSGLPVRRADLTTSAIIAKGRRTSSVHAALHDLFAQTASRVNALVVEAAREELRQYLGALLEQLSGPAQHVAARKWRPRTKQPKPAAQAASARTCPVPGCRRPSCGPRNSWLCETHKNLPDLEKAKYKRIPGKRGAQAQQA